jgi:hypothetical protein
LLRRALTRAPVDIVFTGDYQAAERKFLVSRQMLEVCLDLGFPALVLERSPWPAHPRAVLTVGVSDRMPPPIIPDDKRALNKRIVEVLANQCYWMEADNAPGQRAWAYRKAAWATEDLEQDVGLIYRQMGRKGLENVQNVGPRLAEVVEDLIREST